MGGNTLGSTSYSAGDSGTIGPANFDLTSLDTTTDGGSVEFRIELVHFDFRPQWCFPLRHFWWMVFLWGVWLSVGMRFFVSLFLVWGLGFCGVCWGNTELRGWTLANGGVLSAAIDGWDEPSGVVTLKKEGGEVIELKLGEFSVQDQAWVKSWKEMKGKLEDKLTVGLGTYMTFHAVGNFETDFYAYYPSVYEKGKKLPMMLLFHPGGKGQECLLRHFEAAEKVGMILVTVDVFRNTGNDMKIEGKDGVVTKRFGELLPQLEASVEHDPKRFYIGGMSGGAWRAFHYSAWFDRPWAGIYSNVGWIGDRRWYGLPYPAGMRVAMVNGHKDHGLYVLKGDAERLKAKGSESKIFMFEGGHQVAPMGVQVEAFEWLLDGE